LRRPVAQELPEAVPAYGDGQLGHVLEVGAELARLQGVGTQLVDHAVSSAGAPWLPADDGGRRSAIGGMGGVDRVVLAQGIPLPVLGQEQAPEVGGSLGGSGGPVVALT